MPNIQIEGPDESVIGTLTFTICHDREELEGCHKFRESLPTLEQCLHYVGMEEEYPIAFLKTIYVDEAYWRCPHGYGSSLMHRFEEEISNNSGCKMTACQVGWPPGKTRESSISFYKYCKWNIYDQSLEEIVMAFKALDANSPNFTLKSQTTAKMNVYWKDENFTDSLAPRPVG